MDFMPHGHCFFWTRELLFGFFLSDIVTALSYFSIPFCLIYVARRRKDTPQRLLVILFVMFICSCGATHVLSAWNIWHANYYLEASLRTATALVSAITAFVLWRKVPELISAPGCEYYKRLLDYYVKKDSTLWEVLELSPAGVAYVSLAGEIMKCNSQFLKIVGWNSLSGMSFADFTDARDIQEDISLLESLIEGKIKWYRMEKRHVSSSGEVKWALLSVALVRDTEGKPSYCVSQIRSLHKDADAQPELPEVCYA